ncbi:MAG: S-methyl-5'-thioinosine phosphorylase [Methylococcales symbiont of Iophon sp. n. MRB-2018]|nr:MAG: S-methyl-5'-thioinosine phosphorylase [Methylococcales symbiont of Iophon sp. n. MRB-2018]KAF3979172.1 MAG: S-methyl-5'-thioinosine phosphorylase [Methylococcales symbiont of Iophon sp. n. MRB-2018]
MSKLAIIGGTGLNQIDGLEVTSTQTIKTPYGQPSADFVFAKIDDKEIIFLARHGSPHSIPPHKINYRANIWGLKEYGVTEIIAIASVGGITPSMSPTHIVLPDQIIDYSYHREHTFFAENLSQVTHIDFTHPYNEQLRTRLIQAAEQANITISHKGTYGCTQGPRLESSAEIIRMQRDGCDLVGMTGMPEAALAKELALHYASIAVVANWAAGKSENEITMDKIEHHVKQGMLQVLKILKSYINRFALV